MWCLSGKEKSFADEGIITLEEKVKMISDDIEGGDCQGFISLLFEFPKLFINDF